jgi:hypothetical protein
MHSHLLEAGLVTCAGVLGLSFACEVHFLRMDEISFAVEEYAVVVVHDEKARRLR